ncbi:hypothetical protein H072_352 [Dactylellina haptotyla CBS 200.50]|uniref:Mid2 domain-containing protein n=1 Tax=Dactylellina haptotyla (strain CBS 200.50) TaxID=1284197 RepID=S8C1M1_DACHA|nr:hypothetical protein H072_352 [Dactylellina haptotyla CBS 200.50]
MLPSYLLHVAIWAIGLGGAVANPTGSDVTHWGPPGVTSGEIMRAVRRSLSQHSHEKRATSAKNSTAIEKRWSEATLINFSKEKSSGNDTTEVSGGIEVLCTSCYLQTNMTATITMNEAVDIKQEIKRISVAVQNVTNATFEYVQNYTRGTTTNLKDGIDLDDFNFPPLDVDFNIDTPKLPGAVLTFQFDGLEIYVALNTVFSSGVTYVINLYTLPSPLGLQITKDLFIGVVPSIDLILSAEQEINISSGFHIRFNDGFILETELFGVNVTQTVLNGGKFQFLPVTVESAGVTLKAILRITVRAGYEISTPGLAIFGQDVTDVLNLKASTGIEVSVWAHVAELATSVTIIPNGDENNCKLRVEEWYQCAVGAAAGATVAVAGYTWGPTPETSIPIWGTTFTQCAISGTVASTSSAQPTGSDLTTKTISTNVTYRAIECLSTGLVDCPVSLQSTTKVITGLTLVTAVSSGVDPKFPITTESSVGETSTFAASAQDLISTSGTPSSATSIPTISVVNTGSDNDNHHSHRRRDIILGVCIGLGVPILLGIIFAIVYFCYLKQKLQERKGKA